MAPLLFAGLCLLALTVWMFAPRTAKPLSIAELTNLATGIILAAAVVYYFVSSHSIVYLRYPQRFGVKRWLEDHKPEIIVGITSALVGAIATRVIEKTWKRLLLATQAEGVSRECQGGMEDDWHCIRRSCHSPGSVLYGGEDVGDGPRKAKKQERAEIMRQLLALSDRESSISATTPPVRSGLHLRISRLRRANSTERAETREQFQEILTRTNTQ